MCGQRSLGAVQVAESIVSHRRAHSKSPLEFTLAYGLQSSTSHPRDCVDGLSLLWFFFFICLCLKSACQELLRSRGTARKMTIPVICPYDPDILSVNYICSALKIEEPIAFPYESYSLELRRGSASPCVATSSLYASTTQAAGAPLRTPRS